MTNGQTLVVVKVGQPKDREAGWTQWLKEHHIPVRFNLPGFLSARVYKVLEGIPGGSAISEEPMYLALYDLVSIDALLSESYKKLKAVEKAQPHDDYQHFSLKTKKFAYGVYNLTFSSQSDYSPPKCPFTFLEGYDVPRGEDSEIKTHYINEHMSTLMKAPGVVAGRRFTISKGTIPPKYGEGGYLPTYLSVYDVENISAFESETFVKEMVSERNFLARESCSPSMCVVYKLFYRAVDEFISQREN